MEKIRLNATGRLQLHKPEHFKLHKRHTVQAVKIRFLVLYEKSFHYANFKMSLKEQ